jgi:hypothetical protein
VLEFGIVSERGEIDKKRFAIFKPVGIAQTDGGFTVEWISIATDKETGQRGEIALAEATGASSWTSEEIRPDGGTGDRKFFFSGATWTAPWQPQGPGANWKTAAKPKEPIN